MAALRSGYFIKELARQVRIHNKKKKKRICPFGTYMYMMEKSQVWGKIRKPIKQC
jgi:hypothetical protein